MFSNSKAQNCREQSIYPMHVIMYLSHTLLNHSTCEGDKFFSSRMCISAPSMILQNEMTENAKLLLNDYM